MAWTIDYSDTALRQLRKLDRKSAQRIFDYMQKHVAPLEDARSTGKALKGPLGEFWRYRVGNYRIICELRDQQLHILVVRVGSRKDVYR